MHTCRSRDPSLEAIEKLPNFVGNLFCFLFSGEDRDGVDVLHLVSRSLTDLAMSQSLRIYLICKDKYMWHINKKLHFYANMVFRSSVTIFAGSHFWLKDSYERGLWPPSH